MTTETNNNTFNSQSKSYINSSGKNVLEYITPDTIVLDLSFIMIQGKRLTKSMPYMLLEGSHTKAVRLLNVRDAEGVVYLNVQELLTDKTCTLFWNMEYTGDHWLWSLADFETLTNIPMKDE
jgi:hypothetical protein